MATHSSCTTEGITVTVDSTFSAEHSRPQASRFFFLYQIRILNEGSEPAQLMHRHWIITDANGDRQEVRGPGVIGETPRLLPGQAFQYVSGCPLTTSFGAMEGSYEMQRDDGSIFRVRIAPFSLALPHAIN